MHRLPIILAVEAEMIIMAGRRPLVTSGRQKTAKLLLSAVSITFTTVDKKLQLAGSLVAAAA